jgi:hypothetical protein
MKLNVLLLLAALLAPRPAMAGLPAVHDGDIIFHTSRSSQSVAIQRATKSPYSHMGMVFFRGGRPFVLEAVSTVRYTPLEQWIDRGVGRHFVIKRLGNAATVLTPAAVARLRKAGEAFLGRPYDLTFEWSDDRIYCSELVWKAYDRALGVRVGRLQKLRDFDLSDREVRARMRQRYGDHIPFEEPVISPVSMFDSPALVTVVKR